jgi:hypothetical protein
MMRQGTLYLLFQEVLLGADDGAWPANSDPSNDFSMCEPVVLHDVTGYQRACSSKTSCRRGKQKKGQVQQIDPKNG